MVNLLISISLIFVLFSTIQDADAKLGKHRPITDESDINKPDLLIINELVSRIDKYVKDNKSKAIYFGDIADAATEKKSKWLKFVDDKERNSKSAGDNLCEQADVWIIHGHVAYVEYFHTSPSGDWVYYINYYYREDGTVAKIESELRTSIGSVIIREEQYIQSNSTITLRKKAFFDLKTDSPTEQPEDYCALEVKLYKTVRSLPFFKLLK